LQRLGITLILLGIIGTVTTLYLIDSQAYAQGYYDRSSDKKSYAEKHNLEPIIDKDGKKQFLIMYKDRITHQDFKALKTEGYAKIKNKFDIMPAVIVSMDEKWVPSIKAKKNVVGVYEDFRVHAVLDQSVPQISADQVQNSGLMFG